MGIDQRTSTLSNDIFCLNHTVFTDGEDVHSLRSTCVDSDMPHDAVVEENVNVSVKGNVPILLKDNNYNTIIASQRVKIIMLLKATRKITTLIQVCANLQLLTYNRIQILSVNRPSMVYTHHRQAMVRVSFTVDREHSDINLSSVISEPTDLFQTVPRENLEQFCHSQSFTDPSELVAPGATGYITYDTSETPANSNTQVSRRYSQFDEVQDSSLCSWDIEHNIDLDLQSAPNRNSVTDYNYLSNMHSQS